MSEKIMEKVEKQSLHVLKKNLGDLQRVLDGMDARAEKKYLELDQEKSNLFKTLQVKVSQAILPAVKVKDAALKKAQERHNVSRETMDPILMLPDPRVAEVSNKCYDSECQAAKEEFNLVANQLFEQHKKEQEELDEQFKREVRKWEEVYRNEKLSTVMHIKGITNTIQLLEHPEPVVEPLEVQATF
jgi:hypothetical protein